ncbi:MAG: ACT domain-containing protein [Acidobacteria bacterium]|nr:ACT domain-containing protein [Acidobacteriota bacterium]MBI3470362.1 ACT domain-containing protein [Candidatus Solibacter usitatus]
MTLTLKLLDGRLAVCRLSAGARIPAWALDPSPLTSVTRTAGEISVVCPEQSVPSGTTAETGWRAFEVEGPLDFALTGVLAALAQPLAAAGVTLFALSTYDTDYVLVKESALEAARGALAAAGHRVL